MTDENTQTVTATPEQVALREQIARALAEHSGWSQSGPDDGVHLNCFDCGDDLGLERVIVSDWIHRTGKDPAEWNTHGAVPAYDERLAEHQADAILPIVARVEQEAYRRGQVEALREASEDRSLRLSGHDGR